MSVLKTIARSPAALSSLLILSLAVCCALFPQWIAPYDPFAQSLRNRLAPSVLSDPASPFLLGTDHLGRDILSRIIYGSRTTLLVCTSAVAIAAVLGVVLGMVAGYYRGWRDALISRFADMQLSFPVILLIVAVVAALGPSLATLIVVIGVSSWPQFARVVRASVMQINEFDFVLAARTIGVTPLTIILRHIFPNILPTLVVYATYELAKMILLEAMLSYLGLGVPGPIPTWGLMISEGQNYIAFSWASSVFPGIAIALTILAVSTLGDFARDVLDPHHQQRELGA